MGTMVPEKIIVKKGYSLTLSGVPSSTLQRASKPETVGVLPSEFPFIKPKALVKEGDTVHIGTPLFLDKHDPRVQFLSPAAGVVDRVVLGERRRLDEIVIRVAEDEKAVSFQKYAATDIATTSREQLVAAVIERGLWPVLRERPFGRIPSPDVVPPSVYVSLDPEDDFLPQAHVVLGANEAYFRAGLSALSVLTSGKVSVAVNQKNKYLPKSLIDVVTHVIKGDASANTPEVFHYHAKASAAENTAWTLGLAEVIRLGESLIEGQYPVQQVITVSGIMTAANGHFLTRIGAPVSLFLKEATAARYVAGSVMTGRKVSCSGYLGLDEAALVALPEGQEQQFLSFVQPGFDKYSFSKAFLSALLPKKAWTLPTTLNGSHRACIECGACAEVCSVDLLPQLILKQVEANDQEEAVTLGLLDCTACGMCTYVCPSKIEISDTLSEAKTKIFKELRS
jgi:Na+-transporting NADH:ubiquinone oxidoreductase subunit A